MWEKIAATAALASVIISIIALLIAKSGADKSLMMASEALQTARQSNDISMGLIHEYPIVEIFSHEELLDFTTTERLKEDLKIRISIRNPGKLAIDGLAMELIGIEPLTYPEHNPNDEIRPLPSVKVNAGLDVIIQPGGLANIDMRTPILKYLAKLDKIIDEKSRKYRTTINVVLMPKAVGASLPSGVLSNQTRDDRKLITILFEPSIMSSEIVKDLLDGNTIAHRVYSP